MARGRPRCDVDATRRSVTLAVTMPRRVRTLLLTLLVVSVLAVMALVLFTTAQRPTKSPLPNPNGYDDFVSAGAAVDGSVGDYPALDRAALGALVSTNAEALRLLRLGLTRRCTLPIDLSVTNDMLVISQLGGMKRLAQLLAAEGQLRQLENRTADAAGSYLDIIRLGNEISRGGFLISRLVGVSCESIGCSRLAKVGPELEARDARIIVTELEKLDANHVTWAEVERNERRFTRSHLNPFNLIPWLMAWRQTHQVMERAETKHKLAVAHERLLAGELALRCYQSENMGGPVRLDDLLTNYLSKVPEDPFTGRPMIYHTRGTRWMFYSVGVDRVDDGGRPAGPEVNTKGDLFFDSPW